MFICNPEIVPIILNHVYMVRFRRFKISRTGLFMFIVNRFVVGKTGIRNFTKFRTQRTSASTRMLVVMFLLLIQLRKSWNLLNDCPVVLNISSMIKRECQSAKTRMNRIFVDVVKGSVLKLQTITLSGLLSTVNILKWDSVRQIALLSWVTRWKQMKGITP